MFDGGVEFGVYVIVDGLVCVYVLVYYEYEFVGDFCEYVFVLDVDGGFVCCYSIEEC